jgi:uncharacterized membrane protein
MGPPWLYSRVRRGARVWVIPAVYILAALVLGRLIPRIDARYFEYISIFSAQTAVSLLSAIASGMLTFTGFVFSITFLIVQFGSSAYSPRVTQYFLQDPIVRHSLGMFIATFLYALIALSDVNLGGDGVVSDFTILVAIGGVLLSAILFLALMQHVTSLQVDNVLHMIGDRGRQVIHRLYPQLLEQKEGSQQETVKPYTHPSPDQRRPSSQLPPATQVVYYHGSPLAIIEIDVAKLAALASSADAVIEINYPIGDNVPDGAPLLEVHGGGKPLSDQQLSRAIEMSSHRTIEQDPKYAFRLIVDIAVRALSPALNDPTTAVQALDQLDDLLRRIGSRRLDVGYAYDKNSALRVVYPTPGWEDYLDLALDEIRYYGATSLQVMRRLRALLEDLQEAVPAARRGLIEHHIQRVDSSIRRSFVDLQDRVDAQQPDRQGIGLTRPSED